jgi:ribosomal protein S18 acetylase RimI-like enzyme
MIQPPYRRATPDDAAPLAELVNMAGEGLPLHVWTGMAEPGQDPWLIGRQRAARATGSFSYRNAIVREEAGAVVAALIGYPLADTPAASDLSGMPAIFVPLQVLEDRAPATWYINVLATYPAFRGRGYGTELLAVAEQLAVAAGKRGLSLIVSDGNPDAIRLYRRAGFVETARRAIVRGDWTGGGQDWILMIKPF